MKKILTVTALIAAFSSVSATSFAEELNFTPNEAQIDESAALPTPPRFRRPLRSRFVCTSRNIQGRTFRAYGNYRTPLNYVRMRSLQMCRNRSFILGRTCRVISCHRF